MTAKLNLETMDQDMMPNETDDDLLEMDMDEELEQEPDAEQTAPLIALEDSAQQKRLIEALLFASPEPVSLRSIQNRLPETADVGALLLQLEADYKDRGVQLMRFEDAWAFRSAADLGPYLSLQKKQEKRLSRAALETLSIIAYHQPVTRAEVENIRGVATNKGTLDVLMEAGWIKPGRRRETPGRPVTWMTTTHFLDEFGISGLNDLPGLAEMKASGLLDVRPAIDTIPSLDLFDSANENEEQKDQDIRAHDPNEDRNLSDDEIGEDANEELSQEIDDEMDEDDFDDDDDDFDDDDSDDDDSDDDDSDDDDSDDDDRN
jgi:segregation and condensation protein B